MPVYGKLSNRLKNEGAKVSILFLLPNKGSKIATGLAAALFYLHDQLETQIIHRDVKASNVMLDSDFNAWLRDFGLARWLEHDRKYQTTPSMRNKAFRLAETSRIGGTIGYLPPENFQKRVFPTAKSDVFKLWNCGTGDRHMKTSSRPYLSR